MFTGLIEKVGELAHMEKGAAGTWIEVRHSPWLCPLRPGDSVAVQGICLTVRKSGQETFVSDTLDETLNLTNLGQQRLGNRLNLERALRFGDRMAGHFVTGHVDGVGLVHSVHREQHDRVLEIECPTNLLQQIVLKGSVACDGVSLTVAARRQKSFHVRLIPHTWENTSLGDLQVGEWVNIETDILGKYVRQATGAKEAPQVTSATLKEAGFL